LLAPHVTALPETTGLRLDDALPPIREAFGGRSEGPEPAPRFFRLSVEVRLGRHRSLLCSTLDAARNRVILRELSPCGV